MPKIIRLIAVLGAFALAVGSATSATAATPTAPGAASVGDCRGHVLVSGPRLKAKSGFRTECVGLIQLAGKWGVCIDYGRLGPDGNWATGAVASIGDKRTRERVIWLANARVAQDSSPRLGTAVKAAINRLVSDDFRFDWSHSYAPQLKAIDPEAVALADKLLEDSQAGGDVKTTTTLVAQPKPGGVGVVEVTTKGAGHPVTSADVTWKTVGVNVISAAKQTRADGSAVIKFSWDGDRALSVTASVESPDSRKAVFSTPRSGRKQHLIRGGYSVKSSASVRYDQDLGVSVEQDCPSVCTGNPPVTVTVEAGARPTTWQALIAGHPVKTLTVPAGKKVSVLVPGAVDGDRITFRYRVGKTWRASGTTFTVVCPPWPTVTIQKTCVCKATGTVTYTVTYPGGVRADVVRFAVNGQTETRTLEGTETFTAPLSSGTAVSLAFSAFDKPGGTELVSGVLDAFTQN